jgi:hypothetical protein
MLKDQRTGIGTTGDVPDFDGKGTGAPPAFVAHSLTSTFKFHKMKPAKFNADKEPDVLQVTGVIPGHFKVHEQDYMGNLFVYKKSYGTELEARLVAHTAWLNCKSIRYAWISQEIIYY